MKYLIMDTETTGLGSRDEVIQRCNKVYPVYRCDTSACQLWCKFSCEHIIPVWNHSGNLCT